MMDLSIEAIEADLSRAEQTLGRPESAIHMQRAQVRATLLAAQQSPEAHQIPIGFDIAIDVNADHAVYLVPNKAIKADRIQAAAHLLGLEPDDLAARLSPTAGTVPELVDDQRSQYADEDIDEDFFAEARKEHKGGKK